MSFDVQYTFSIGDLVSIIVPIITLIIVFVSLRENVKALKEKTEQLDYTQRSHATMHSNILKTLSSHSTALEIRRVELENLTKTEDEIKIKLHELYRKIEDLNNFLRNRTSTQR